MDNASSGNRRLPSLLLVEDNPGDVRLIEEAFGEIGFAGELHVVSDGDDALDFVYQRGDFTDAKRPDLILLDSHLPSVSGEEIVKTLKGDFTIPIIALTGSSSDDQIRQFYDSHANAAIRKPTDPNEWVEIVGTVEEFWLHIARIPEPESEEDDADYV